MDIPHKHCGGPLSPAQAGHIIYIYIYIYACGFVELNYTIVPSYRLRVQCSGAVVSLMGPALPGMAAMKAALGPYIRSPIVALRRENRAKSPNIGQMAPKHQL